MIKFFNVLFSLLFTFSVSASCIPDWIPCCFDCEKNWTLEVRCSAYTPQSSKLKKIYSTTWLYYDVEASKRINDHLEGWVSIGWTGKQDGKSFRDPFGLKNKTKINIVPVGAGLKMIFPVYPCIDLYLGAGICYSFLELQNICHDDYSSYGFSSAPYKRVVHSNRFGAIGKVGFQYAMSDTTFLDFFADYYAQQFHLSRHEKNVFKRTISCDGFKFGAGFGVYF